MLANRVNRCFPLLARALLKRAFGDGCLLLLSRSVEEQLQSLVGGRSTAQHIAELLSRRTAQPQNSVRAVGARRGRQHLPGQGWALGTACACSGALAALGYHCCRGRSGGCPLPLGRAVSAPGTRIPCSNRPVIRRRPTVPRARSSPAVGCRSTVPRARSSPAVGCRSPSLHAAPGTNPPAVRCRSRSLHAAPRTQFPHQSDAPNATDRGGGHRRSAAVAVLRLFSSAICCSVAVHANGEDSLSSSANQACCTGPPAARARSRPGSAPQTQDAAPACAAGTGRSQAHRSRFAAPRSRPRSISSALASIRREEGD